jgi:hypothetical protein
MRPYSTSVRPSASSVCSLKLLVYAALSYYCVRPEATRIRGLKAGGCGRGGPVAMSGAAGLVDVLALVRYLLQAYGIRQKRHQRHKTGGIRQKTEGRRLKIGGGGYLLFHLLELRLELLQSLLLPTAAYVSIRQHTSAYVSIRQHTSACVSSFKASSSRPRSDLHIYYIYFTYVTYKHILHTYI